MAWRATARVLVRTAGEILVTVGMVLLLFVAWQLWWTDVVADREQAAITEGLAERWDDRPRPSVDAPTARASDPPPEVSAPAAGEAFGILWVPRFGPDWQERPIVQGESLNVLERGIGHYTETAMPGAVGNFALAGHRVTYGRPFFQIEELEPGDPIVVETADTWFVYRMRASTIVTPDRIDVVAPVPERRGEAPTERLMTLTTCHPKFSARQRYIVYAELDTWQPRSTGPPDALSGG